MRHRFSLGMGTALWFVCGAASAQSNEATATELFNKGKELMASGDSASACPKLEESARLDPKVGSYAKLADCDEKMNKLVAARNHWQKAVNVAERDKDARLALAKENFERLDKVVPKVILSMATPFPPELAIRLDGLDVSTATLGIALPVEIGNHKIDVTAKGKKPWSNAFVAASGAPTKINVPPLEDGGASPAAAVVAPTAAAKDAPAGDASKPSADSSGGGVNPVIGYVLIGAGVVGGGIGTYFGLTALSKNSDSNKNGCTDGTATCTSVDGKALRESAFSAGTASTVSFIVGGVLAGAGIVVLTVFSPPKAEAPAKAALSVGPGSLMLKGTF